MKRYLISLLIFVTMGAGAVAQQAPRYIFYFIGDGMGMGQVMAAEAYNRTVLDSPDPLLMMQFPVASAITTHSWSSPVTDSAAAGTALATGHKTRNGMLGMAPDSTAVTSIAAQLADEGYGIAIVTSVPPDDATPGAFYAHVPSRKMYYEIGCQAAESGYDFIAGAKLRGVTDKNDRATDLPDRLAAAGVTIARGLDQAEAAPAGRVMLLNPEDIDYHQIHFTIDSVAGAMTLPEMTRAALTQLQRNGRDRFFMMVEGGNIDYGGHANDGGTIIKEVLKFNEAIAEAYAWYLAHPDETLIIVTADHETGGMSPGNNAVGYDLHLNYYDAQRISKDRFAEHCRAMLRSKRDYTWVEMKEFLTENLGFWKAVPVTEEQEKQLEADFDAAFLHRNDVEHKTLYNSFNTFTEDVYRVLDSLTGIGWTSSHHTAGLVPVYAIGVGQELFVPFGDNTSIPDRIGRLAGVR